MSRNRKMIQKYLEQKNALLNFLLILISLLIALASMVIAINSLLISERVYIFASKDYLPEIEFQLKDSGIILINKSNDIFSIEDINILEISQLWYLKDKESVYLQIPLITYSYWEYIYEYDWKKRKFEINFDDVFGCAYSCPFDKNNLKQIQNKIYEECGLNEEHCFIPPYLEEPFYIINVWYIDKFNNHKNINFKYLHIHWIGEFKKLQITDNEFNEILKETNIPKFNTFEEQRKYIIDNYTKDTL